MKAEPQKEHVWLQKLAGDWTYEIDATMEPGKPPIKTKGTESVRSLGGVWILGEGQGEMPGGGMATMILTLGYDPQKQRFIGTWIGSMMTHMWIYNGTLDASGKVLTLDTEGPSMAGDGKMSRYQDIIEVKSDNERTLSSQVLGEGGKWNRFMTATYRRSTGA
jgi:hypothetical protein